MDWRIYHRDGKYRVGKPVSFLWFKWISWYKVYHITNRRTGTETWYDTLVEFETPDLTYARNTLDLVIRVENQPKAIKGTREEINP